jgi:hypothetical protein
LQAAVFSTDVWTQNWDKNNLTRFAPKPKWFLKQEKILMSTQTAKTLTKNRDSDGRNKAGWGEEKYVRGGYELV